MEDNGILGTLGYAHRLPDSASLHLGYSKLSSFSPRVRLELDLHLVPAHPA